MSRWLTRFAVLPAAALLAYLGSVFLRRSFCTLAQQLSVWTVAFIAVFFVSLGVVERRLGAAWTRAAAASALVSFILLVLVSLSVANLLGAVTRSRQIGSRADVRAIAEALNAERDRAGVFPAASSVSQLNSLLGKTLPERDRWGNPVIVRSEPRRSVVISLGECGQAEQPDPWAYQPGATHDTTADIVFLNGKAWRYPEGIQE